MISYKPAAARIPCSHAEEKKSPGVRRRIVFLGAAERIPHSHAEEKKNVRGPGGVFFFLGAAVQDLASASAPTHRKQREGRHLQPEFRGRSTRQRHDARKTTRVATYAQNFEDAPRATSRRAGNSEKVATCQRHAARKTTRGSPLTPRISRTLHAPASRRAENSEKVATYVQKFEDAPRASVTPRGKLRSPLTPRVSRTLHAPASRRAENSKKVATYVQNFGDAQRASVTTRGKQREGRHLQPEFRGRSTRQRHDARKTARRSPLTSRILRTLHAPASRRAENNEKVATYAQNFEDAPRASVTTCRPTDRPPVFFQTKGKQSVAGCG